MAEAPPIVLTVAGFDPSAGAGVTADIKTIAAHGCYGVACITALTVQSTVGVSKLQTVDREIVTETLGDLTRNMEISGRKIGMVVLTNAVMVIVELMVKET